MFLISSSFSLYMLTVSRLSVDYQIPRDIILNFGAIYMCFD